MSCITIGGMGSDATTKISERAECSRNDEVPWSKNWRQIDPEPFLCILSATSINLLQNWRFHVAIVRSAGPLFRGAVGSMKVSAGQDRGLIEYGKEGHNSSLWHIATGERIGIVR